MRFAKLGLVSMIGALVLTACGTSGNSSSSGSTIKIGVTGPLSGKEAAAGQDIVNAAKVVADTLNKSGGVNGQKVEVLSADDQCDAQVGVQAAQSLLAQHVIAIVGGFCSGAVIPETDVLRRQGDLPFIADAATNPKLTDQGYDNVFRIVPRDDFAGALDASFMTGVLHSKRVAIMHDNTTYALGLAQFGKNALLSAGATVTYYDAITPGQKDYTSALTRVASTNPDTFYFTGYYTEAAIIVKEYKDLGLDSKFKFMGGGGVYDNNFLSAAGSAADGTTIIFPVGPELATGQEFATFKADYKRITGQDVGTFSIYEHDAVMLLALAIKNANSTKPSDIIHALHNVTYDGITGHIQFNEKGDRLAFAMVGYQVKSSQFTPMWKETPNGSWVAYP